MAFQLRFFAGFRGEGRSILTGLGHRADGTEDHQSEDRAFGVGQLHEALKALAAHDLIEGAVKRHQSSRRPAISRDPKSVLMLKPEDVGHLAQLVSDDPITWTGQQSTPLRKAAGDG